MNLNELLNNLHNLTSNYQIKILIQTPTGALHSAQFIESEFVVLDTPDPSSGGAHTRFNTMTLQRLSDFIDNANFDDDGDHSDSKLEICLIISA